jgi:hypothetical protein
MPKKGKNFAVLRGQKKSWVPQPSVFTPEAASPCHQTIEPVKTETLKHTLGVFRAGLIDTVLGSIASTAARRFHLLNLKSKFVAAHMLNQLQSRRKIHIPVLMDTLTKIFELNSWWVIGTVSKTLRDLEEIFVKNPTTANIHHAIQQLQYKNFAENSTDKL